MDYEWDIPSGHVKIAIENDPVEIVDLPIENGGSFHSYVNVYQRVVSEGSYCFQVQYVGHRKGHRKDMET